MDQKNRVTEKLKEGGYSFVLYKDGEWSTSEKRGIAPIMELLSENKELLSGAYVADKVIGKAAAMLLIEGGISYLHAEVISEHATECLQKYNIEFEYQNLVPYIVNRTGDGMCPMEETVLNVTDTKIAYNLLQDKIKKMQAAMQQNMKS
ncbi:DUF1893 domain-containing protein [Lachnoclostridium phytofermentans]|uniref:DUF1893 domain-containing protein n=1 Tax=Lachnoclostridium phytofermentans TaxID=66219 RepID=UPI0004957976|nr:DUF1893 domain-containing protein [Lachnoclostridium phytofermentans]